jgi:hypothetical protein
MENLLCTEDVQLGRFAVCGIFIRQLIFCLMWSSPGAYTAFHLGIAYQTSSYILDDIIPSGRTAL